MRANEAVVDGELGEGRGRGGGGRGRLLDGAPTGGDSGDQLMGYGLNWDGAVLEECE